MLPPAMAVDGSTFGGARLVIVNNALSGFVPYLDAELIYASATIDLPIDSGQHKAVVSEPVDTVGARCS